MPSFNQVTLMGNLTRDVELRYTQSAKAVTDIGLAVNERRKLASGEWVDEPVFVDVTLWGRQAEVAGEYLRKGSPVLISGKLKLEQWETDGQKRSKLKVTGLALQLLGNGSGPPQQQATATASQGYAAPSGGQVTYEDDDIPF